MTALIFSKISAVMNDIEAITKAKKNVQQGYNFRGIDDVYNELHGPLTKHCVFTVPEVLEERTEIKTTKSGSEIIYRILKMKYTFFAEDGSSVCAVVIGEGMDSGDKASNKAMAVAHKYALMQIFAIPTEDLKDPENESHDLEGKNGGKKPNNAPKQPYKPSYIPPIKPPVEKPVVAEDLFDKNNPEHGSKLLKALEDRNATAHVLRVRDMLQGKNMINSELDKILKTIEG